jgi:hypothetical protein
VPKNKLDILKFRPMRGGGLASLHSVKENLSPRPSVQIKNSRTSEQFLTKFDLEKFLTFDCPANKIFEKKGGGVLYMKTYARFCKYSRT